MGNITVTAANGVRAKATLLKRTVLKREIPEVKDALGALIASARTEEFETWSPEAVVTFASEAREFEIGPGQRLLIEEQQ